MATREENIKALADSLVKLSAGVTLSDAVDSELGVGQGTAATPKAVKTAYDYTTDVAQSVLEAAKNATEGSDNVTDLREPLLADVYHEIGTWWISLDNSIPVGGLPHLGHLCARDTYVEFWTWCETNKTVVSDEEWLAYAESHNGCCPYYSYGDGSTTFRTPKYDQSFLKILATIGGTGEMEEAGLPNITGSAANISWSNPGPISGAFYEGDIVSIPSAGNDVTSKKLLFDASRSDAVYGNSDTVTPQNFGVIVGVYAVGAVSAPVGETDAANLLNGISTLETQMATTVRSVNGVSADAAGNVVEDAGADYTRFSNGLQICSTSMTTGTWTFPKPFISYPGVLATPALNGQTVVGTYVYDITTTSVKLTTTHVVNAQMIALGRWK